MIFKVIPEEKQQLVEQKDADNIRKVLFKSFIHSVVLRIKFVFLERFSLDCRKGLVLVLVLVLLRPLVG